MSRIEEIDAQIKELKAEKKRLKEQKKYQLPTFEDFIKECNNEFYVPYTSANGTFTIERCSKEDRNALSIWIAGETFISEAECQKWIDKQILTTRFKRFVKTFLCEEPIDWSNIEQSKCYLYYDHLEGNISFSHNSISQTNVIYWTNKNGFEIIKQNFTETELKIILGVE